MSKKPIYKPNFFIIGAPKCGTTSLWHWLSEHPQIFLPKSKEPHFFSFDYHEGICRRLEEYESMFDKAQSHHRAIGESSTSYLQSATAIPAILRYSRRPRIVVAIRNPIDMAISLHNFLFLHRAENKDDFWTAWQLQSQRRYGAQIPPECSDVRKLWYADICRIGSQLRYLYEKVPERNIHLIQLEEVKTDPRAEYLRLLEFLDVKDDGRTSFQVANEASKRHFKSFWSVFNLLDRMILATGIKLPKAGFMEKLDQFTRKRIDTGMAINARQRAELVDYFKYETRLAEEVSGLCLDHWRR